VSRSNRGSSEHTNSAEAGSPLDVLLVLDRSERRGLSAQLQRQLRSAIQLGRLVPGTLLPPSRTLAHDIGVARSVVVDAYQQLAEDGYVGGRQGSGTRVLTIAHRDAEQPAAGGEPRHPFRLIGGLPDPGFFPRTEWLRHYRAALNGVPNHLLGYPGPTGAQPLRQALTNYLGRVRGVVATADQVLITTGITQALVLVCRALRSRGVEAVAVEDPCFGFHRDAIRNTGLRAIPIPVDGDGLDVAILAGHDVGAVLVAPAHSYPSGAVLSAARRAELVAWARERHTLVIEDDYDAEFRYDRAPIGALQGLAPEQVAYAGCVSKTLTPALRLGWITLPGWLAEDVVRQKLLDDMGSSLVEQLALASFIASGALTRHLRRVRPIYRRRRDTTLDALSAAMPGAMPSGVAAGLHLYVQLPTWCDESGLIETALGQGLLIEGASWHWSNPQSAPPALVLGYGALNETAIHEALVVLGSIYQRQQSR
jgi:GntR family transcriptional regulator/MocR family aminotransferase